MRYAVGIEKAGNNFFRLRAVSTRLRRDRRDGA